MIESAIPEDHERYGPVPPPPRTAHAPGAAIYPFDEVPAPRLLRLREGYGGFFLEGEEGKARPSALLVLMAGGAGGGDVLVFPPSLPLDEIPRASAAPRHHIKRDALSGRGVPGITGLRTMHGEAGLTVLRLGPPPGARWVFVGLSAVAVFAGKLTLVDGEDAKVLPAGSLALVSDPTATLYVEAGNDSALAVALGAGPVVSALA